MSNDLARWEAEAAQFLVDTGLMHPGKDDPRGHHTFDERVVAHVVWSTMRKKLVAAGDKEVELANRGARIDAYHTECERLRLIVSGLRAALIASCRALPGCACTDDVSNDFLTKMPHEIAAYVARNTP